MTTQTASYPYEIYCGTKAAMEMAAARGVRMLNPRTMKRQIVDKSAKYLVVIEAGSALLWSLRSDKDLRAMGKAKGLIA